MGASASAMVGIAAALVAVALLIAPVSPGMAHDDLDDEPTDVPRGQPAPTPGETPAQPGDEVEPITSSVPEDDRIDILNIDRVFMDREGKVYSGEGNIRVIVREPVTEEGVTRYEEIRVSADTLLIDENADVAIFTGNVRIEREHMIVTQHELRVDLSTKAADASGGIRAELQTELFMGPWPMEPLFIEGDTVHVEPEVNFIRARRGLMTSCSLTEPHYSFLSPDVKVTPGKQLRLKRPRLRILNSTVRYPGNLTIPLDRRRSSIIPTFGQNRTEGRFLHIAVPYTTGRDASGAFRLNVTEQRGRGYGIEHFFYTSRQDGEVVVFWEPQERSFTSRARHGYDLTSTLIADTTASFQRNSGFARGSTESSNLGIVIRNRGLNATSELSYRRGETTSSFSTSLRSTVQFRDDRRYGGDLRSNLLLNFRETGASSRADDLELNTQIEFSRRSYDRPFDWRIQAERRFDPDGDSFTFDDNLSILERSPVLTLNSSTERLNSGWFREFPIDTELSVGLFRQRPMGGDIFRTFLNFGARPEPIELGSNSEVNWSTQFRQGFYSDGTAQYVIGTRVGLRNRHGRHWESDIGHDFTDPKGFSPLRTDAVGVRNAARWGLTRRGGGFSGSLVQLTGGFDFERDRHYDMLLRSQFPVAFGTLFQLSSGYSIERDTFRPLLLELERSTLKGVNFGVSTRYDIESKQLGRIRGTLDLPLKKWHLEALAGYNGVSKELDFADIRVTRDLHCWIASATYSMQQRSLQLNLGIKAFAIGTPALGHGIRGQSFDLGQGSLY